MGQQLVAQADAQDRHIGLQGLQDALPLPVKDRIVEFVWAVFAPGKDHGVIVPQVGNRLTPVDADVLVLHVETGQHIVHDQGAGWAVDEDDDLQRPPRGGRRGGRRRSGCRCRRVGWRGGRRLGGSRCGCRAGAGSRSDCGGRCGTGSRGGGRRRTAGSRRFPGDQQAGQPQKGAAAERAVPGAGRHRGLALSSPPAGRRRSAARSRL